MPPFDHVPLADRLALARHVLALSAPRGEAPTPLEITPRFVRATPPGARRTAAYLTLRNAGADDALIGARSAAAASVSLHRSAHEGGVMRMEPVERLALPSGATVELEPGGLHLMLEELRVPLAPGATVAVELLFLNGPPRTVELPVLREVPK